MKNYRSKYVIIVLIAPLFASCGNVSNEKSLSLNSVNSIQTQKEGAESKIDYEIPKQKPQASKPTIGIFSRNKFAAFRKEAKLAEKNLNCKDSKTMSPTPKWGLGFSYGCIQGKAKTVKWFVSEMPGTGRVKNVKLMWNDWFEDGELIFTREKFTAHGDKNKAQKALNVLVKMYAPEKSANLNKAFWGKKNKIIIAEKFELKFTYRRGNQVDERLIVVTEKKG